MTKTAQLLSNRVLHTMPRRRLYSSITPRFNQTLIAQAVALSLATFAAPAFAVNCPAAVGGTITVANLAVDQTCTLGAGESLNVNNTGGPGSISSLSSGVFTSNGISAGDITNSGTILGFRGIFVGSGMGNINNSGTISGQNAAGVAIRLSASVMGNINNNLGGTINNPGGEAISILSGSSVGTINNSGTISAGGAAGTTAINIDSGHVNNITNNATGSITTANVTDGYAINVRNGGSAGTITNNGNISGGTGAIAVASDGSAGTVDSIINNGSIAGDNTAIFIGTGHVTNGITNTGSIVGDVILNDATLNLNGTSGSITGQVRSFGGNGLGISVVNVNGTFTQGGEFRVGTLNINSGGVFNMDGNDQVFTGAAGVNNAGTLALGAGFPSAITGNYTQSASGVLQIGVAGNNNFGRLTVVGNADLSASNKINVNVIGAPTLTIGNVRTVLFTMGGTVTVGPSISVTDNSSLFNFTAALNLAGDTINLTTTKGLTIADSAAGQYGGSSTGAATVLDGLSNGGGTPAMQTVITQLGALSTAQQVADATQQTLPAMTGGMGEVAKATRHGIDRIVQARQDANSGFSSGDDFYGDKQAWFKPIGSWTSQGDRKGVPGFDANTYGAVGGLDGELSNQTRIGVAFAYAHTSVDGSSPVATQTAGINSYNAIVYGSHSLDDRTDLTLQGDVGLNKNKTNRNIPFAGVAASGEYDSWAGHIGVGVNRRYAYDSKTMLIPGIRIDYTNIHDQSYTETGAGALNLAVNSNTTDELIVMAEGRVAHKLTDHASLMANLGLGYDLLSDRTSITSSFAGGGAAFTTRGIDPSPVLMRGGAGFVVANSNALEVTARLDFELRENFDNETASLRMKVPF